MRKIHLILLLALTVMFSSISGLTVAGESNLDSTDVVQETETLPDGSSDGLNQDAEGQVPSDFDGELGDADSAKTTDQNEESKPSGLFNSFQPMANYTGSWTTDFWSLFKVIATKSAK